MGSDLAILRDGVPSAVWFKLSALIGGGLQHLLVPADGTEPAYPVHPGGLLKLYYLPMQVRLGVRWKVRLFPYDWRLDIDRVSDELADLVKEHGGQPVHLVAHSMGGLVARAMIRRHADVWAEMRVSINGEQSGGRLVMLGTPNRGSFAPALAFTGNDVKLRAIAWIAPGLSTEDIVRVVATFPGLYQMLPAPGALDEAVDAFYDPTSWPGGVASADLLGRAADFHAAIAHVVVPDRMACVAGYGHRTVDGVAHDGRKLRWHRSRLGDGTVPQALGLLPSVPTYWSRASHGSLPKDPDVLLAVDDLLATGATDRLPSGDRAPLARGEDEGGEWMNEDELVTEEMLEALRVRAQDEELSLLSDVLPLPAAAEVILRVPVQVEVTSADIARVNADLLAVGHYLDVYPTAAEGAIDAELSGDAPPEARLLHGATARGVVGGSWARSTSCPGTGEKVTTSSSRWPGSGRRARSASPSTR